jgi:integrase
MLRRMFFPLQVRAGLGEPKRNAVDEVVLDDEGNAVLTGRYSFHELRHAAASGWIANNIDLKRLQVWIGHENIQLTLDTYGHLLHDQKRDAQLARKASRDLFG